MDAKWVWLLSEAIFAETVKENRALMTKSEFPTSHGWRLRIHSNLIVKKKG